MASDETDETGQGWLLARLSQSLLLSLGLQMVSGSNFIHTPFL
jgi:hypothetical protein